MDVQIAKALHPSVACAHQADALAIERIVLMLDDPHSGALRRAFDAVWAAKGERMLASYRSGTEPTEAALHSAVITDLFLHFAARQLAGVEEPF
jgi:hypothetical protein